MTARARLQCPWWALSPAAKRAVSVKAAARLVLCAAFAGSAARAGGSTCAANEILNDKLVAPNYDGTVKPWNAGGVTVYDYRKCGESSDPGNFLDGQIVASSLGAVVPSFEPAAAPGNPMDGEYRVYAPDSAHQAHKLLLYLSGQPDTNAQKDQLLQRAAYHGYHVLATRYWNWNPDAGSAVCGSGPDSSGNFAGHSSSNPYTDSTGITYDDCVIRLHRNQFQNVSSGYTPAHVGPAGSKCVPNSSDPDLCQGTPTGLLLNKGDAAQYRIRKLLTYLDQRHPNDGWGQYAASGGYDAAPFLNWSKITMMGHSSGSQVSFHLQHDQADIDRVILLSGPNLVATRKGTSQPANLESYVTTPGSLPLKRIYAFSNTHDPKFSRAHASWLYMTGKAGAVGLPGVTGSGGWEAKQSCTGTCPPCAELSPAAPPAGSSIRAIQYSGNAQWCVGKASGTDPIDGSWAHESTTENSSCAGATPDTCWYLKVWDYVMTN